MDIVELIVVIVISLLVALAGIRTIRFIINLINQNSLRCKGEKPSLDTFIEGINKYTNKK